MKDFKKETEEMFSTEEFDTKVIEKDRNRKRREFSKDHKRRDKNDKIKRNKIAKYSVKYEYHEDDDDNDIELY